MSTSENDDLILPSELDVLKQRASLLGIVFSNNIGLDALRKKIQDKQEEPAPVVAEVLKSNPLEQLPDTPVVKVLTLRNYLLAQATKLVRLRITNMDPKKADLPGEIFTVANEHIGTIKKYVPFGESTDEGYHVPYCIYEMLKGRQFLQIKTKTNKVTKQLETETRWVREFALDVLPDLTPAEIAQLAAAQTASGRLD